MGSSTSTLDYRTKASNVRKNPCLLEAKKKLYADRSKTGDVKFLVGSEVIHAHRCVLAALSPKYETEFYGSMPESDLVHVKDISPAAFNEFLQFFYTEDVTLTIENIEDVLNLAKQSLNEKLVTECTEFLLEMVALDKLCWCYELALLHDIKSLQEFCEDHIGENIKTVFETKDFLGCKREVLYRILKLDTLNCNETEVFAACIAWAQAMCKKKQVDKKSSVPNVFSWRAALGDEIIEQIRFCVMTVEEFAAIDKKYAELLSVQESNAVYRVIGKATDGKTSKLTTNIKPRVPTAMSTTRFKDDALKSKSIECSLIGRRKGFTGYPPDNDSIAFICDQTIVLNGFTICNKIVGKILIDIEIGARHLKDYNHTASTCTGELTKIIFTDPILVNRYERCCVKVKSKVFQQHDLVRYSTVLEKEVCGVWFQILKSKICDEEPKLITQLLFNDPTAPIQIES